jgi:hypothetical protein
VCYLFVVTVIIYAQFSLQYFEDGIVYGDDTDAGCHSAVRRVPSPSLFVF